MFPVHAPTLTQVPDPGVALAPPPPPDPLRQAAEKLETAFLSEMLKASGLGETPDSFGGGIGEEQFASFLRDAQAREMVRSGGIGLAEVIYHALKAGSDAAR